MTHLPEDLNRLLDDTPYGRVTVEVHRVDGSSVETKVRSRKQFKTPTFEQSGAAIGQYLEEVVRAGRSGRLDIQVTFQRGELKFTYIEAFTD